MSLNVFFFKLQPNIFILFEVEIVQKVQRTVEELFVTLFSDGILSARGTAVAQVYGMWLWNH